MKFLLVLIITLFLAAALAEEKRARSPENPLEHLPANIEALSHFGERADISPDNQRVAFMTKSFGDAMVIDLRHALLHALHATSPLRPFSG